MATDAQWSYTRVKGVYKVWIRDTCVLLGEVENVRKTKYGSVQHWEAFSYRWRCLGQYTTRRAAIEVVANAYEEEEAAANGD